MPFRPGRFGKPSYMETYDGVLISPMPITLHPDTVSRKALAAGSGEA